MASPFQWANKHSIVAMGSWGVRVLGLGMQPVARVRQFGKAVIFGIIDFCIKKFLPYIKLANF
jgi:bacteriorhodopsin